MFRHPKGLYSDKTNKNTQKKVILKRNKLLFYIHNPLVKKNFPVKTHEDSEAGWKVGFPPLTVTFVTNRTAELSQFLTAVLHYSIS